ncbi:MAG: hypothetical protein ACI9T9_001072 [Oleiphilaceae bacterium]|jgi:hypothetical protein
MNVSSIQQTGLEGIQRGLQGIEKSASEIVKAGVTNNGAGSASFIEPIADLKLYERSIEASAKVVQVADEVLGSLLDTVV